MGNRSVNKVILMGNLVKDPESGVTQSGNPVCNIILATNRKFKTGGETKESTEFHRITAWGNLAEVCTKLLKKGNKIYVEGYIETRKYTKNGVEVEGKEIVMQEMSIASNKNEDENDL